MVPQASGRYQFGVFELDREAMELRKRGVRIRLQEQPFRILCALLEAPGEIVSREKLKAILWPDDTFVEFERGMNAAVAKLRQALGDSADNPRFVETIPRRGYRFIGAVSSADTPAESPLVAKKPETERPWNISTAEETFRETGVRRSRHHWRWPVLALVLAIAGFGSWWVLMRPKSEPAPHWERITADAGLTTEPAISPDGKLLAYASDRAGGGLHIWVQQLARGGQAIQITSGDADEHEPSFSPDGSKIVFRSEQNGGGIYVVPTLGGERTLLAPAGHDPRFSPDGFSVVYWKGRFISSAFGAGSGEPSIFLVRATGGTPRELPTGLAEAAHPVWSPDGAHILIYGTKKPYGQLPLGPTQPGGDWWILPASGGTAKPTGAFAHFRKQGLATTYPAEIPRPGYWAKDAVVFFARQGDTVNLWRIPISSRDLVANGPAKRLTAGTEMEAYASLSQGGRLAFAGLSLHVNLWSIPVDLNQGKATGSLRRLTQGLVFDAQPSVCPEGGRVVFNSTRSGSARPGIWSRDLESGRETLIVQGDAGPFHPQISTDCSRVAYTQDDGDYLVPATGGPPQRICSDCSMVWGWSQEQKRILFSKRERPSIHLLDLSSKEDRVFVRSSDERLFQARLSPDERWVIFLRETEGLWMAPVRNGSAASEREWSRFTESNVQADKPRWSSDGKIVYYTADRDGFWCLWAQRVDPATKRPMGLPLAVYHFHSARLSMANAARGEQEISVGKDMIVLNLGELTGNVWASPE
ncbi:MAG TPA: winged helix-turn-helix domain-containing protein [Bryobacteraceae bacterium]|nr:winged helix-turn-helix domain-containing protein [Bryobacteraceae bacterium]